MKKVKKKKFSNAEEQTFCIVAPRTLVSRNIPPRINIVSYFPVYLREEGRSRYLEVGSISVFAGTFLPGLGGNFILPNLS